MVIVHGEEERGRRATCRTMDSLKINMYMCRAPQMYIIESCEQRSCENKREWANRQLKTEAAAMLMHARFAPGRCGSPETFYR